MPAPPGFFFFPTLRDPEGVDVAEDGEGTEELAAAADFFTMCGC